jgi:hypothetical protein
LLAQRDIDDIHRAVDYLNIDTMGAIQTTDEHHGITDDLL